VTRCGNRYRRLDGELDDVLLRGHLDEPEVVLVCQHDAVFPEAEDMTFRCKHSSEYLANDSLREVL